jgi:alanyl-tRNA synthetase
VDEARRLDIARNHTATHLLQLALRRVLGEHVQQRGSLVAPDRLRFDFSHLEALNPEELYKVNRIVNDIIRADLPVYDQTLPYSQAIAEGAIALFDEKYGDEVRVVKIGEASISAELCGGTHVRATGEIGFFRISSEGSIGAGLRRIEAASGRGAEEFISDQLDGLHKVAEALETSPAEVPGKVSQMLAELETERRRAASLENELSKGTAVALLEKVEVINGIKVVAAGVASCRMEALREISDRLREKLESAIIVLGALHNNRPIFLAAVTPDLVAKGYNAGQIVNQVAQVAGGKGGGKAHFAQAGGRDKDKLDEAISSVLGII